MTHHRLTPIAPGGYFSTPPQVTPTPIVTQKYRGQYQESKKKSLTLHIILL